MMPLFVPQPKISVLATSVTPSSHTGNTTETALATISIPAGIMGTNKILRIQSFWTVTANTNTKTARHRFGGLAGTEFGRSLATATAANPRHIVDYIMNRNSASAQLGQYISSRTTDTIPTSGTISGTIDTTLAQDFILTGQLGTGTDTITLEAYIIELIIP